MSEDKSTVVDFDKFLESTLKALRHMEEHDPMVANRIVARNAGIALRTLHGLTNKALDMQAQACATAERLTNQLATVTSVGNEEGTKH